MKEWGDKLDLLAKMAQARHDARESVPKSGGNDAIEAAMFVAQWKAIRDFLLQRVETKGEAAPGTDSPAEPTDTPVEAESAPAATETDLSGLGGPFPTELGSDELLPKVSYDPPA